MGQVVVVNGAGGLLGQRVVRAIAHDPDVARVVAVDRHPFPLPRRSESPAVVERAVGPGAVGDVAEAVAAADAIVHLGPTTVGDPGPDGTATASSTAAHLWHLLERRPSPVALVVLSSATVYGACADNPVPLTEAAPRRPSPGSPFAVERAAVEDAARAWQAATPGATVALLRPAVVAGREVRRWFAASPWAVAPPDGEGGSPRQLLHLDDLAAAIDLARRLGLDGPRNVAPEGWMPAAAVAELAGPVGRLRSASAAVGRRLPGSAPVGAAGLGGTYVEAPWVVASDLLRGEGWAPQHANEEVFVEADAGGRLTALSAKRRQQLSLGVSAAALTAAAATGVALVRRRR